MGHEVTVFTPGEPQNDNYGFKVVWVKPLLKIGNASWVPQMFWKLRGFDVIHLHLPFLGVDDTIMKWKIISRQKMVVTYHHDLIASDWRKYIFGFWKRCVLPIVIRVADKIIGSSLDYIASSNAGEYYKSHPQKFVGIPFGVDTEKFYPKEKSSALLQQFSFSVDEKIILFVGGLDTAHNFKGVEHLINAAKILKDKGMRFRVLIVGDGDLRPGFEKKVLDLELRHVVKFFAGGREVLPDLYNLATVEVLPSTTMGEAFGLVLLEAMACGKPVIASNLPGVRTVCGDGVNGLLVRPGDEKDLSEKLARILTDENLAAQFGAKGLDLVREKYNWKKVAKKHVEVYENLFNK